MGAFGEKLRKQREQQGIALDAISNTTKISTRMLRALEDEHFDQLPGGVFNKGFVRAYARQVGLNEEEAVADYLAALRESQIQANSIPPDFRDSHNKHLPNTDLRNTDLPGNDFRNNNLSGNDAAADRSRQLLRDDRRKQGRRNDDRRNDDRRNDDGRNEDGRNEDGRNEDGRNDGGHDPGRRPKDLSSPPDSAAHVPAAHPPTTRFRKKYPAGNPEQPANATENDLSLQLPWGKLAVALLLVTFVLALWNSRRHREPAAASLPIAASSQSPLVPLPSPFPRQPHPAVRFGLPNTHAPAPVTAPASAATQGSGSTSLTVSKTSPAGTSSSGTLSQAESTTKPAANLPGANPPVVQRTASAAPANPLKTFTLLIRAEKTTWVSIVADGKPVAQETLIAPAHTSVRASGEVVVKTGNAAGVSFLLNGKEIPVQGNEGEVKTYVFDATGFRVLPQP